VQGDLFAALIEDTHQAVFPTRPCGYRSSEYQTAMLYFVADKLEIPYYAK
jgi:hypothetical protein